MSIKILGVTGSLREKSHSTRLLKICLEQAQAYGAETKLLGLRETPLPLLFDHHDPEPENLPAIREQVEWADAIIITSPDYHGSVGAAAKNFLDYFWKEFTGKLFGYIIASHEKGLTVQDQLRTCVRQCYGWSLPYGIGFNGDADFDTEGNLINSALEERTQMMARDISVYGALLRDQLAADRTANPTPPTFGAKS